MNTVYVRRDCNAPGHYLYSDAIVASLHVCHGQLDSIQEVVRGAAERRVSSRKGSC